MATKKKKYRTGSGTQGVVRNYLPDPIESNAKADLLSAKADAEAFDNPFAMGLDMMAMYSGQIAQGLGSIKGAYGLEGEEQINVEGGEVVDDPTMGAMEMEGPSHDDLGIDMNVSPETDVFSVKVKDADGKSMADKKKKREKMKKALVKMLEEDHLDKARKNAYKRKLEQLEAEEEKDLTTQDQAGMFAELLGLPHTGEDGYAKYGMRKKKIYGEERDKVESVVSPYLNSQGIVKGDIILPKSNTIPKINTGVTSEKNQNDFDLPFQLGDVIKLAGNLHGMTSQMRNVKEARAEDTPHPNHYKDVGRDAIATLEGSKGDLDAMGANQESRVRKEASANKRRGRQSARGINQMRAMDAVSNMQTTMADMDIFDMIAKQKMGINQSIASTEMGASQAKAQGSAMARDLTDRDRHAYFTAKGSALGDVTKGLQQTGKDFNQMALNPVQMRLLEALGEYFTVDKQGNIKRKTE